MSESVPIKPNPTRRFAPAALMIFAGMAIGGGGWLVGKTVRGLRAGLDFNISFPGWPALILGSFALMAIALAAHELGHLRGGRLAGFRFMLFIAGPLKVVRESDGVRVRLNKAVPLYGGMASALPVDDRDLPRRIAVMIAGGPLASLALGAVSATLAVWLNGVFRAAEPGSILTLFAFMLGLLSMAIFLVTIIPGRTSGFDTDGAQWLDVLRGGHRAELRGLMAALSAASADGARPRAWNATQLERLLNLRDGKPDDVMVNLFGYYHFLDAGKPGRAGELLDLCVEQTIGLRGAVRPMLFAEAAYFMAFHRQDAATARRFLQSASGGLMEPHTRLRAEAAVLLAEDQPVQSIERARAGLAQADRGWDRGGAMAEKDWLAEVVGRAESRAAAP